MGKPIVYDLRHKPIGGHSGVMLEQRRKGNAGRDLILKLEKLYFHLLLYGKNTALLRTSLTVKLLPHYAAQMGTHCRPYTVRLID